MLGSSGALTPGPRALSPWIDFGNFLPGKAEPESGDPVIGMVSLLGIPQVWCGPAMHDKACSPPYPTRNPQSIR